MGKKAEAAKPIVEADEDDPLLRQSAAVEDGWR